MKPSITTQKNLHNSRGVALITTLLLLSLFMVMTLAMVIATNSDTLINGYYRDFRGSFYGADSGLNISRQFIVNQFQNTALPTGWTPSSGAPFGTTTDATILSALTNTSSGFGSYQSILGSQSSWPGAFKVDTTNAGTATAHTYLGGTLHPPTCFPTYTGGTSRNETCTQVAADATANVTNYAYSYPYQITVVGQARNPEQNTIVETGSIVVNIPITTVAGRKSSFAAWGTLLNSYPICSAPFVTGTMTGPFFSNDSWNFGDSGSVGNGSYIFTGAVGAHNANVGYMYSDGTCHQSSATSDSETVTTTSGWGRHQTTTTTTTTISPQFQGGLTTGMASVPLPQDTFDQAMAVIDGKGDCTPAGATGYTCNAPTQAQMNGSLRTAAGTAWPSSGTPSSGVYVPYTTTTGSGCAAAPCFTGGGLYVQGNADQIVMTASTSGSDKLQVFQITQGSVVTTVTLDLTANGGVGTTTVTDNQGHSSGTINGLPMDQNNSPATEGCMVYVTGGISGTDINGNTTGVTGPASGAAIQDGSAVTITANSTVAITGNILYSHEPVTESQQGSTPADTLIPGVTNVLGIYTSSGDIQIRPTNSMTTMEVDASLAMISQSGSGGLVAQWNHIGTLNIVGGRIANVAKSGASLGQRNIWFDQRFSQGGFAPPWFPSTTLGGTPTPVVGTPNVTASRVSWLDTTAQ